MKIFPAIDLVDKKAVRLYKGDYNNMTVYSDNPFSVALDFKKQGAEFIHLVDLEGAKSGETPNIDVVEKIAKESGLFTEIGGGVRSMETIEKYFSVGVDRVILGTVAVTDPELLESAVKRFGDKIAVGADVKDGFIAIKGWTEKSEISLESFFEKLEGLGVKTVICTDISRDGAMMGTNLDMYRKLSERYNISLIASGGVSSMDDVKRLREMDIYGAIIGKAYYTGAIDLKDAIGVAK